MQPDDNIQPLPSNLSQSLARFLHILSRLRRECPWDSKQTWDSLRTLTIEEAHELSAAIADANIDDVRKELGDVFLHVAFYALIAQEQGLFALHDVLDTLSDKLIQRHPAIFGGDGAGCTWEQLKLRERNGNGGVLDGVPPTLPALIKAYRIQGKARGVGFDWKEPADAWDKLSEETNEFKAEVLNNDREQMTNEMGDLLFSVVNIARLYGINPEDALERTNRKFITRFKHIEEGAAAMGKSITDLSLTVMDKLWVEAKSLK